MVKLIVATGPNNLIGCGNNLCWNLPDELKFFKAMTLNSSLFMGQRTFEGLPKKLPNRKFYVLGMTESQGADFWLKDIETAKAFLEKHQDTEEVIWISGGKFIYETFYKYASEIYVSEVITDVKGDVFLDMDLSQYKKTHYKDGVGFTTYLYQKEKYD